MVALINCSFTLMVGDMWQSVPNLATPNQQDKFMPDIHYIIENKFLYKYIMKKLDIPKIEPINVKQYEFKQSPYPQADKLPFRSIIVSASQGGKGILIQNLVLKIYKGCFERIYIVSPTAHIDEAYKEVIRYIQKEMKIDNNKEQYLYDEYNAEALEHIINTQHKVIEYQKKMKMTKLFSCLLIIDDFAEDKTFMRYSKILHGLYTKSRHFGLSVITASQKYNALAPIVRLNTSSLYIFKLKNMAEVDAFVQEQSALVDKKTVYEIYNLAVNDQPYSFLFVKLRESDINKIFMVRLEKAINID